MHHVCGYVYAHIEDPRAHHGSHAEEEERRDAYDVYDAHDAPNGYAYPSHAEQERHQFSAHASPPRRAASAPPAVGGGTVCEARGWEGDGGGLLDVEALGTGGAATGGRVWREDGGDGAGHGDAADWHAGLERGPAWTSHASYYEDASSGGIGRQGSSLPVQYSGLSPLYSSRAAPWEEPAAALQAAQPDTPPQALHEPPHQRFARAPEPVPWRAEPRLEFARNRAFSESGVDPSYSADRMARQEGLDFSREYAPHTNRQIHTLTHGWSPRDSDVEAMNHRLYPHGPPAAGKLAAAPASARGGEGAEELLRHPHFAGMASPQSPHSTGVPVAVADAGGRGHGRWPKRSRSMGERLGVDPPPPVIEEVIDRLRHLQAGHDLLGVGVWEEGRGGMMTAQDASGARFQFVPPFVTLTYAQGVDGSITKADGGATIISGEESMLMTHHLRARHDAILVGVGTVRKDDPSLTVRLCAGPNPRPVILDSALTTPRNCRLVSSDQCERPILAYAAPGDAGEGVVGGLRRGLTGLLTHIAAHAAGPDADRALKPRGAGPRDGAAGELAGRKARLERHGCVAVACRRTDDGRVDVKSLLLELTRLGIRSVMVEGGAEVIATFLRAGLANFVAITIAPRFLSGLPAVAGPNGSSRQRRQAKGGSSGFIPPFLEAPRFHTMGRDVVLSATCRPLRNNRNLLPWRGAPGCSHGQDAAGAEAVALGLHSAASASASHLASDASDALTGAVGAVRSFFGKLASPRAVADILLPGRPPTPPPRAAAATRDHERWLGGRGGPDAAPAGLAGYTQLRDVDETFLGDRLVDPLRYASCSCSLGRCLSVSSCPPSPTTPIFWFPPLSRGRSLRRTPRLSFHVLLWKRT